MGEGPEIPLARLREVTELLLAHAERDGGSVTLDHDLFWELLPEQRHELGHAPTEHTVGRLSESWAHLTEMADDPDRVVGYGLVWLADVLRALGHQQIG
ncbi:hypothetical protein [Amycolatopsis rifamycinica]|uniref:Uncharacterized protein n=1 Tax=Amycolatopsis rifamycinica TaxID=287986 RepID=A0A066U8M2_9PSEU|nr:hypothetical protein [Amycolatopsis rifamycinica]KDN20474.1 hypothetical protein DV20_21220 [Amycolatopsis rifamycinica]